MKPLHTPAQFARPPASDAFGRVSDASRVTVPLSYCLHQEMQRLANFKKMSDAAFVRGLIEREVIILAASVPKPHQPMLRVNGVNAIVHSVAGKKGQVA